MKMFINFKILISSFRFELCSSFTNKSSNGRGSLCAEKVASLEVFINFELRQILMKICNICVITVKETVHNMKTDSVQESLCLNYEKIMLPCSLRVPNPKNYHFVHVLILGYFHHVLSVLGKQQLIGLGLLQEEKALSILMFSKSIFSTSILIL